MIKFRAYNEDKDELQIVVIENGQVVEGDAAFFDPLWTEAFAESAYMPHDDNDPDWYTFFSFMFRYGADLLDYTPPEKTRTEIGGKEICY